MSKTVAALLNEGEHNRALVIQYQLLIMRDGLKHMRELPLDDNNAHCLACVASVCAVEWSENTIGDHHAQVATLSIAIDMMRRTFGKREVNKFCLHANLLNNMCCVLGLTGQFIECTNYNLHCMEAVNKVGDITEDSNVMEIGLAQQKGVSTQKRFIIPS